MTDLIHYHYYSGLPGGYVPNQAVVHSTLIGAVEDMLYDMENTADNLAGMRVMESFEKNVVTALDIYEDTIEAIRTITENEALDDYEHLSAMLMEGELQVVEPGPYGQHYYYEVTACRCVDVLLHDECGQVITTDDGIEGYCQTCDEVLYPISEVR